MAGMDEEKIFDGKKYFTHGGLTYRYRNHAEKIQKRIKKNGDRARIYNEGISSFVVYIRKGTRG